MVACTKDNEGRLTKCTDSTGYWCELTYQPNGFWKHYRNSLGFNIEYDEHGNTARYYTKT